jgi:sec-independent protein translocase protein TatC
VGVFAGYLLVLHREHRRFPWRKVLTIVLPVLLLLAVAVYIAVTKHVIKLVPYWPFLTH